MTARDCAQQGHVWLEGTAVPADPKTVARMTLYSRSRERSRGGVAVVCYHCHETRTLEGHSPHTAPPRTPARLDMSAHEAKR